MTTYRTTCWGDEYEVSADWSQASSPVDGPDGGRQVADYRHSPAAAMRDLLEQVVRFGGDDPEGVADEIDEAIDGMYALGSDEHDEHDGYDRVADTGAAVRHRRHQEYDETDYRLAGEPCSLGAVVAHLCHEHDYSLAEAIEAIEACGPVIAEGSLDWDEAAEAFRRA